MRALYLISNCKIELDGQDITACFDGTSILLPGNNKGTLKIFATPSGIESVEAEADFITGDARCTAFDTTGRAVYSGLRAYLEDSVAAGLYIVKSGDKTEKILVK